MNPLPRLGAWMNSLMPQAAHEAIKIAEDPWLNSGRALVDPNPAGPGIAFLDAMTVPKTERRRTLGILALQGAFEEHEAMFKMLPSELLDQIQLVQVRKVQELDTCDALVIPGGESTTMKIIAGTDEFMTRLREYVRGGERKPRPVWGTCAGCILLSEDVVNTVSRGDGQLQPAKRCKYGDPVGGLDVATCRNFFGRQAELRAAAEVGPGPLVCTS
ncbi:unnamed protein product [Effrenium voratum]|uniref:glutaminase n=1 Tax=Effrenium voratum TaxID=2562239 RepID=A0AA36N1X1_9DINO|nr:unnamed protein product [Effrenium voratum]